MKKYITVFLILLASITSIYAYNEFLTSNISLDNLTQINVYYKDSLKATFSPSKNNEILYVDEYNNLINSINNMKRTDIKPSIKSDYKIDLIDSKSLRSYMFYSNLEDKTIYVNYDNQMFKVDNNNTTNLFDSTLFDELYYHKTITRTNFVINNVTLTPVIRGNLTYNNLSGEEMTKSIEYTNDNSITTLEDFEKLKAVKVNFLYAPKSTLVRVYDENVLLDEYPLTNNEINLLKRDGLTSYKVISSWASNDRVPFNGEISYEFSIDLDLSPEFQLVSNNKGAGEFFILKALYFNDDEKPVVKSDFIKNKKFEKNGDTYILIIPLNYYQKQSKYEIELYMSKSKELSLIDKKSLTIENRKFTSQNLKISKSTVAATSNDKAYTEFDKYFTPLREKSNAKPYFTESFMLPIDGRISTEFGMMRYVNGSLTSYRHSGIDIAVPRGTPVPATNSGKILLARELILTGNTVVIDHGVGLFSVYYHMDTLNVSIDDMVKKADIIGTVGSTGRSTGPHLHFTTSFYKTNLNPKFLINLSESEINNLIN